jgi:hypothetical protein
LTGNVGIRPLLPAEVVSDVSSECAGAVDIDSFLVCDGYG